MPKIVQHKLKSLSDYIQIVQDLQAGVNHPLWFRGMTDQANPDVIPSPENKYFD